MGCYYLTMSMAGRRGEGMVFHDFDEVELAHSMGKVDTHARIRVKLPPKQRLKTDVEADSHPGALIETTAGRVLFN